MSIYRIVNAPLPQQGRAAGFMTPLENMFRAITLADDEEVEWTITHTADGGSYVSGYIIHKNPAPRLGG